MKKVERLNKDDFTLSDDDYVKLTTMGQIQEIRYFSRANKKQTIQLLEDRKYLELSTGEIKDCKEKSKYRLERINMLRGSYRKLRNLINANVDVPDHCQWLTLTYKENMQDHHQLYTDFSNFHKRYKYYLQKIGIQHCEYIAIPEPQGRGAWHFHIVYIYDRKAPFVSNEILREIWKKGFVKINRLSNAQDVGRYIEAYLTDLPLDDMIRMFDTKDTTKVSEMSEYDTSENIKIDSHTKKRYIKGARLLFYPAKFRIYRASRGVRHPREEEMTYNNAKKKVNGSKKTYERTIRLIDGENDFESIVHTECYLTDRHKGSEHIK